MARCTDIGSKSTGTKNMQLGSKTKGYAAGGAAKQRKGFPKTIAPKKKK